MAYRQRIYFTEAQKSEIWDRWRRGESSNMSRNSSKPDITLAGLAIWVISRQFPDSDDYWDGNWLNILARVEAPGARVEVGGSVLRTDEIARFHAELAVAYRDLNGTAELDCMEPELGAKVTCNGLGQVQVLVEITPDNISQRHQIEFSIDQSYLKDTLAECADVLSRFPVKGAPEN